MPFQKGDKNINRSGRPGKPNKSTEEMRQFVGDLLNENKERIRQAIKNADEDKLLTIFDRLLKHYLPSPLHELQKLTDQDLDKIIEKLKRGVL